MRTIDIQVLEPDEDGENDTLVVVHTAPGQLEDFKFLGAAEPVARVEGESVYSTPFGLFARRHLAWVLVK